MLLLIATWLVAHPRDLARCPRACGPVVLSTRRVRADAREVCRPVRGARVRRAAVNGLTQALGARAALWVLVATTIANVLAYGYQVVMARLLRPSGVIAYDEWHEEAPDPVGEMRVMSRQPLTLRASGEAAKRPL